MDIKMKKYKFEIQNLINVTIEADSKECARKYLIDNLKDYKDEFIQDCGVSNGEEE